jgi:hypothetical protein
MGSIVSVLYGAIAYRAFCGITLHAVALLFYKGERHPNHPGFFPALFGDQYRRYRRQPRMLIFTTGRVHRRVDRTAPASADAADRIPAGPSRTTYQLALGD